MTVGNQVASPITVTTNCFLQENDNSFSNREEGFDSLIPQLTCPYYGRLSRVGDSDLGYPADREGCLDFSGTTLTQRENE